MCNNLDKSVGISWITFEKVVIWDNFSKKEWGA